MIFRIAARNSALRLILNPNGKDTEVTKNIRTFALPFEERPYTFTMEFDYDSWNRIQKMTYPDKEEVSYGYDSGGMLRSMTGCKDSTTYKYIDSIHYNKFGLKKAVCYGNRATTFYKYDVLQRLSHLHSTNGTGNTMQDIDYKYDAVSNIVGIANGAGITANGPGGKYENTYEYDNLYRLVYSNGRWDGAHPVRYELKMNYTPNGRIVRKHLDARTCMQMPHATEIDSVIYCNEYHYTTSSQPNTLTSIDNGLHQDFKWDAKGNLLFHHTEASAMDRSLCWDERNRLAGVKDHEFLSYYQYDANGDRVFKISGGYTVYNRNGHWYRYYGVNCPTLYASPYMVATLKGYTKHYYAESERVASRIGGGGLHGIDGNDNPDRFAVHAEHSTGLFNQVTDCLEAQAEVPASPLKSLYEWKDKKEAEKDCYWYHSDHLGSSSWITGSNGKAVEHLHYMPWGEDFVRQRSTDWHARYTFSAKEKDAETGYSYFGARYYSSDLSIWLSVDPMSDKYPSLSPYAYCADNPIIRIDPTGMIVEVANHIDVTKNDDGTYTVVGGEANSDKNIYVVNGDGNRTGEIVGEMLTEYSFHHEDGSAVVGANINLNDQSGQNFFNNEITSVSLFEYIGNAKGGELFDFKTNGIENREEGTSSGQYRYRGMSFQGKVASARDIGNYSAGYVAGKLGFSWTASRLAFDALETKQVEGTWRTVLFYPFNRVREGQPTQRAERAGYNAGYQIFKQRQFER